ncbi:hypothetical protein [Mycobacterium sp. C31M]
MTNRTVLITGAVGPKADTRVLAWLAESVTEIRPDEIVCTESSPELLDCLREVYAGRIGVHGGSVGDHEVDQLPEFYDIAPGWVSIGRPTDDATQSQIAGNNAMHTARKAGVSVVMGGTYRLGVISETKGYGGKVSSTLTGMEVGNLAAAKRRSDLPKNSQHGFGVLSVDGQHVTPGPMRYERPRTRN